MVVCRFLLCVSGGKAGVGGIYPLQDTPPTFVILRLGVSESHVNTCIKHLRLS